MRMLKYILATILLLVGIVSLLSGWLNNFRALIPGTRLQVWETRIDGVAEEFLRRSPRLRSTYFDYKAHCYRVTSCDESVYFARRDIIISEEWPGIFDRLVVYSDWGESGWSQKNHDEFLYYLRIDTGFGRSNLRNIYVPVLHYRNGELVLDVEDLEHNRVHFVPRTQKVEGE
jgi:hypothetical protein